jgi:uncharacterized glyoxalase superfamily protein PhnB
MQHYKPDAYTSVAPYVVVTMQPRRSAFLERALGAELLRSHHGSGGRLLHAEVRIDDTVVMLGDSARAGRPSAPTCTSTSRMSTPPTALPSLEGALSVQEPVQKRDEDKRGGVKDAGGTTWWISTRVR